MKQKDIILRELNSMGFEPVELGDVGYAFKYESLNFIYMPDEDDEQFLRIAVPYMFDVTDENRIAVLEAMQSTSLLLKYAKVCIMQNSSVWAIYEHYMNATNDLSDLLENIIRVLEATALVFYKKINGEEIAERSEEQEDYSNEELEVMLQQIIDYVENGDEYNQKEEV